MLSYKNPIEIALKERFGDRYTKQSSGSRPDGIEALLVLLLCFLVSMPLSLFLLRVKFVDHLGLWIFTSLFAYMIGTPVVAFISDLWFGLIVNWTRNNYSNIDLTGLDYQEVMKIMGIPISTISVESKVIYLYKGVKVIFTDGRVNDVQ